MFVIYLDNAATSFPKPESVYAAVNHALRDCGGNPGRSGHRLSLAAGRIIDEARLLAAGFFGVTKPERLVFTANTTDALNMAIRGVLKPGDHVVTSMMEHNSVARPLEAMKSLGVTVTKVPTSPVTGVAVDDVKAAIQKDTKLVVMSHVSNVTGTINPIEEIGAFCRSNGLLFLVDAAQSAGVIAIDTEAMNIDLLAFPGHKGLLGPQGTGGLYIRPGIELLPLRYGGTGSYSERLDQPLLSPDRYESGTLNMPGLAGLAAGIGYIMREGVDAVGKREATLANRLIDGITAINGLTIFGPPAGAKRSGTVSVRLDGIDPSEAALILDNSFDIAVRAGLHCAPDAHATLGTLHIGGTLRISIGHFNTPEDIDACIRALAEIAGDGTGGDF